MPDRHLDCPDPIAHTPTTTLAVNAIHSLNELPEARYKLLKGLF